MYKILLNLLKSNNKNTLIDYFSWGRDERIKELNSDVMEKVNFSLLKKLFRNRISFKLLTFFFLTTYFFKFIKSYKLMSDEYSKTLFVEVLLQKIIGEQNLKLSSFSKEFVNSYENAVKKFLQSKKKTSFEGWHLREMKYNDLTIYSSPSLYNCIATNRLYEYKTDNVHICVEPGDVVIDAGIGWGDTTAYFSWLTKNLKGSKVIAVDIQRESLRLLNIQISLNPALKNIKSYHNAISSSNGVTFAFENNGPGAKITEIKDHKDEDQVKSISIDTIVKENNLNKLNFIKMDIEGSELDALDGALESIRKFKPKLAISVYHKKDDLYTIPKLIHSIRSDYKFYLDCTTGFSGETILYCQ